MVCTTCRKDKPLVTLTKCHDCSIRNKKYAKIRQETFKKLGICTSCCKRKALQTKTKCDTCLFKISESHKNTLKRRRKAVIGILGNRCICCGEKNTRFLTLAHTDDSGYLDRKVYGTTQALLHHLYKQYQKTGKISPTYTVECHNCNSGKASNGSVCPHKQPLVLTALSRLRGMHKRIILKYGGLCECCGETELGFLTLDHRSGGGLKERQDKFDNQAYKFYRHLRDSDIDVNIRVLCWNCNCSKGFRQGKCSHDSV